MSMGAIGSAVARALNEGIDGLEWIAASDIGFFVGEAFDNPTEWQGLAMDIAGDEMTLGEFLGLVSERPGQPVVHRQVSWEQYEQEAGSEMTQMTKWFQDVGYSADVAELRARYPDLTSAKTFLASLPASRACLLRLQRAAGEQGRLVADGRDMGSVVFPDADLKVFLEPVGGPLVALTASAHTRLRVSGDRPGRVHPAR